MNTLGLFGVLAGSAVALSLFLSSFFIGIKRKEDPYFLWIGLILLAIGLRIGKSIFYFLLNDMAPFGLALGFLGLASIGPFSWLMMKGKGKISKKDFIHFLVPVVGAIACYMVSPSQWETYLYQSATGILLLYLIGSWVRLVKTEDGSFKQWNKVVLITVSGVWMALVVQHLAYSVNGYASGAVIAAVFLYWLFFQSFKLGVLPRGISVTLPDQTIIQVREAFERELLFKEQGMNLQRFSQELDIPSYLVTRSVKQLYDKTFPETLNHFRVEEIKQMLLDSSKEHLKIESLAYEVGFASPSAFYAAFKKCTGKTPTTYQKEASLLSA